MRIFNRSIVTTGCWWPKSWGHVEKKLFRKMRRVLLSLQLGYDILLNHWSRCASIFICTLGRRSREDYSISMFQDESLRLRVSMRLMVVLYFVFAGAATS